MQKLCLESYVPQQVPLAVGSGGECVQLWRPRYNGRREQGPYTNNRAICARTRPRPTSTLPGGLGFSRGDIQAPPLEPLLGSPLARTRSGPSGHPLLVGFPLWRPYSAVRSGYPPVWATNTEHGNCGA